jgi:hypothetical protein
MVTRVTQPLLLGLAVFAVRGRINLEDHRCASQQ